MITVSTPAGALVALSGDWKAARIFSPTVAACFNTSLPTFPLAPVIRIIAASFNAHRSWDKSLLWRFTSWPKALKGYIDLMRQIGNLSQKMLTKILGSFERNGLVSRILFSVAHYSTFLNRSGGISRVAVCCLARA